MIISESVGILKKCVPADDRKTKMSNCSDCNKNERNGHNYCLNCGSYLKTGQIEHCKVGVTRNTNDNYCGYCGSKDFNCSC
jgi:hypothetical protein